MIQRVDSYFHVRKDKKLSEKFTRALGRHRAVDVYFSDENLNYMVTKHGEKGIIVEFLTGRPINSDKLVQRWQEIEHGPKLTDELKLQAVAVEAKKARQIADHNEARRFAGAEIYDYTVAEKRSVVVGG